MPDPNERHAPRRLQVGDILSCHQFGVLGGLEVAEIKQPNDDSGMEWVVTFKHSNPNNEFKLPSYELCYCLSLWRYDGPIHPNKPKVGWWLPVRREVSKEELAQYSESKGDEKHA